MNPPLAERMRPRSIEAFCGQEHLLEEGKFLYNVIASKNMQSIILWGPPGTGKTTLAKILCEEIGAEFLTLSAVSSGVKDIRSAIASSLQMQRMLGTKTVLFIDEIHRFSKSQQDTLLPHVEKGDVILVGATTETPSFEINRALLSRCRVVQLKPLSDDAVGDIIDRALVDENGLEEKFILEADAKQGLIDLAEGDARITLNALDAASQALVSDNTIREKDILNALQKTVHYDKSGESHYNLASALIKSMRGSDPNAALYYAIRMLEGGEDPRFLFRRLVIFASEDIGNADPNALTVAVNGSTAFRMIGLPEGTLTLTQVVTYLACAPKSNAVLKAYAMARKDVLAFPNAAIPLKILNAPTKLHRQMGNGRGYKYPHQFESNYVAEEYLPEDLQGHRYYEPGDLGLEKTFKENLKKQREQKS